jgi:protein-S-isoprenylcysteine O-methyltransferase Ste14
MRPVVRCAIPSRIVDTQSRQTDRRSLLALRLAYYAEVIAALAPLFGRGFPHFERGFPRLDPILTVIGLALIVAGMALRVAAGRALGKWWSLRAEIQPGHALVQTGPYRFVRHPAYLGMLIVCLGLPIAFQSVWAAVVMAVAVWPAVGYRVQVEDALLERHFGDEYREYAQRTPRLIPGLL